MAYDKYTWTDGELITAQKLNHMENGIEDAGSGGGGDCAFVIKPDHTEGDTTYYDKTWQELADAMDNGQYCVLWGKYIYGENFTIGVAPITSCMKYNDTYTANAENNETQVLTMLTADGADSPLTSTSD